MNKTTSINLGGYFFHIDEDAFRKLSNYFDAVKRSLSPDGREEIINDIERGLFIVRKSGTLGIENQNLKSSFDMFPNPSSQKTTITTSNNEVLPTSS